MARRVKSLMHGTPDMHTVWHRDHRSKKNRKQRHMSDAILHYNKQKLEELTRKEFRSETGFDI